MFSVASKGKCHRFQIIKVVSLGCPCRWNIWVLIMKDDQNSFFPNHASKGFEWRHANRSLALFHDHSTEDCFCGRRSIVMCFAFMGYVWSIKYNAQLKSYFHIFIPFRFRSTISLATLLLKWLLSFLPVVLTVLYWLSISLHYWWNIWMTLLLLHIIS